MKDVPQELTIAFNVGKGMATLFFTLSCLYLMAKGGQMIRYGFCMAILPVPVFLCSKWFIFTMRTHKQNLNVYKVLETKEVLGDNINNRTNSLQ